MGKLVAFVLGCLLVSAASASSLEIMKYQMAINGSPMMGANFQLLVLLPKNLSAKLAKLHLGQIDLQESAHLADAVSAFTSEYVNQGGKTKNLDIVLKHPEARGYVKERALNFYTRQMTDLPLRFSRKGKDVVILPYKSVQSCIDAAQIGVTFGQKDADTFTITTAAHEYTVQRATFEADFVPFFTEACSFVELARHQAPTTEKTGLVFEFTSLKALTSGVVADEATDIVKSLITKFKEEIERVFGESSLSTNVVFIEHTNEVRVHSLRILAETNVTADVNDDYMHTIKYIFSIVFVILLAVVCINMYTMDIYKDSLIYAKFLVKRNN